MKFIIFLSLLFLTYLVIILRWNEIFNFFKIKRYNACQRIHEHEIPRIGGVLIFILLLLFFTSSESGFNFFPCLIYSFIPVAIVSLFEDFAQNTSPKLRLFCMFLSIFIFMYFFKIDYPIINISIIHELIFFSSFSIFIFYAISIVIFMNGMNLIDGSNGTLAFTSLSQLSCLFFISFLYNDQIMIEIIYILSGALAIFLIFNYPFGKIFFGDFGSYLYGFFISLITIYLFGKYNLDPFGATLILFYPLNEIFFSFFRKLIYEKKSPFLPDLHHMHSKLFIFFKGKNNKNKISNNLILPWLSIFWLFPTILFLLFYNQPPLIILSIIFLILAYFIFYALIPRN